MPKINLNNLAMDITSEEGKLKQVDIAQIKEVLKILFTKYNLEYLIRVWFKYNK